MKLFKGILALSLLMMFTLVSCNKDNDDDGEKMSASVAGSSWNASVIKVTLTNGVFNITGTSLLGDVIVVAVKGTAVKSYNLDVAITSLADLTNLSGECGCSYTSAAAMLTTGTLTNIFLSTTGTVSLTNVDTTNKTISGSFNFTTKNYSLVTTKNITNGSFQNLPYTEITLSAE